MLERLIDHAALFPPASMPLEEALEEDRRARQSPYARLLNRFVAPAATLDVLPEDMRLAVVVGSPDEIELLAGRRVEAIELALETSRPESADLLAAHRALAPLAAEIYFELAFDSGWRNDVPAAIGAIAAIGGRVKLRCGGASVPSGEQVALVIACCRQARVPFKATAGLHHAVRRGEQHGFLNLLAATAAPARELDAVLAEEDFTRLELDGADRSLFTSFGSCSWREPVDDLRDLGLLS